MSLRAIRGGRTGAILWRVQQAMTTEIGEGSSRSMTAGSQRRDRQGTAVGAWETVHRRVGVVIEPQRGLCTRLADDASQ